MSVTYPKAIELVLLTSIDTESQFKIREIRNEENVRKWMYRDHVIDANEHLGWINSIKQDDRQIVFSILNDKRIAIGIVKVYAIDRLHKKTDFGYYLTETAKGGLGSVLEYSIINFIFDTLGMEKLNCEVIEGNDSVVKLHKKFLFQEEGFSRSNILKNGVRIGVHLLGLTIKDWLDGKNEIREKYKRVFAKYSVSILWQPDEKKDLHPIDQIEAARARNNLNWMSILRLALEKSPQTAKPIVAEIKRIDREISALTDKLTE
jgi:UDP-4-amino-4,6-dideoxy-N-acetyl-beta-L-altrosamine N-acetyltransferase